LRNGSLAEFIYHTRNSVKSNPHVLLAYAWVLYMALFSGGRHLRAALAEAGGARADFWDRDPSPVRPYSVTEDMSHRRRRITCEFNGPNTAPYSGRSRSRSESWTYKMIPGLQFFNFAGHADGEDMKVEFKKRFKEVEVFLTSGEKEDIVTEAEHIFKFMIEIVHELDTIMSARNEDIETIRDLQVNPSTTSRQTATVPRERTSKGTDPISDDRGKQRKPTFLELLVDGPVAKLVHFRDAFSTRNDALKSLGKRSSDESISQVSLEPGISAKDTGHLESPWTKWLASLAPMILCIVLVSCYYGM
jgi:hypothetical protein